MFKIFCILDLYLKAIHYMTILFYIHVLDRSGEALVDAKAVVMPDLGTNVGTGCLKIKSEF